MEPFETEAALARWAVADLIAQLRALPAEKLAWKPSPEAKSAVDVANECIAVCRMMLPVFAGADWQRAPFPEHGTLEAVSIELLSIVEEYALALEAVQPGQLERRVTFPFGTMDGTRCVTMPLIDLIHHRGQVIYLQSILGDAEAHFDMPSFSVAMRAELATG
jgi:uncharacterized damage-inducible protein DinB